VEEEKEKEENIKHKEKNRTSRKQEEEKKTQKREIKRRVREAEGIECRGVMKMEEGKGKEKVEEEVGEVEK
jgi:hypothetical protein